MTPWPGVEALRTRGAPVTSRPSASPDDGLALGPGQLPVPRLLHAGQPLAVDALEAERLGGELAVRVEAEALVHEAQRGVVEAFTASTTSGGSRRLTNTKRREESRRRPMSFAGSFRIGASREASPFRSSMCDVRAKSDSALEETARTCPFRSRIGPRRGLSGIVLACWLSASRDSSSCLTTWRKPSRPRRARKAQARMDARTSVRLRTSGARRRVMPAETFVSTQRTPGRGRAGFSADASQRGGHAQPTAAGNELARQPHLIAGGRGHPELAGLDLDASERAQAGQLDAEAASGLLEVGAGGGSASRRYEGRTCWMRRPTTPSTRATRTAAPTRARAITTNRRRSRSRLKRAPCCSAAFPHAGAGRADTGASARALTPPPGARAPGASRSAPAGSPSPRRSQAWIGAGQSPAKLPPCSSVRNERFTMRSSPEWNEITPSRPPRSSSAPRAEEPRRTPRFRRSRPCERPGRCGWRRGCGPTTPPAAPLP